MLSRMAIPTSGEEIDPLWEPVGPWHDAGAVSERLGVTDDELAQLIARGAAWAIVTSDGHVLLPARQFTTGTKWGLLPGATGVMRATTARGMTSEEAVYWLLWPRAEWSGRSAVEMIGAGELDAVLAEISVLPDLRR